ncbi:MAG: alpha-glucosidase [Ilumatobacter sp.]|nr:alpha-glucosidase [Ilumatobacter sp.]
MASESRRWWQDALVYQVYVRSFADADGDGIGDLEGIRSRLGHIASLGVDALWLNPCYPSPQRDHGYDVSDYVDIHREYGSLELFDALVADAATHGIKVLMDLVPSHCSNEHPWFRAALAAAPGSAERARFYFRDGQDDGRAPPNNWQAAFGGSAWTRVDDDPADGQWYLGTFTPHQPDFDHTNADVQQMFVDVFEFWFDRGVEGFRVDAVAPTGKHPDLPDQPPIDGDIDILDITWLNPHTVFRPEGHAVWRDFRATLAAYEARHPGRELMMVAEAYVVRRPELLRKFTRPDEFHQMFNFDLMLSPWEPTSIARALHDPLDILADTGVTPAWTLNNHDIQRIVTRLGRADAHLPESWTNNNLVSSGADVDLALGERRARAMAALVFALPGSLYLYQGEELALPEVLDIPDDRRTDPIFALTAGATTGRDGCRVPLPWTTDPATSYGFSSPPAGDQAPVDEPWLPQPADWGDRSVAVEERRAGSTLHLYRELSAARRAHANSQPLAARALELGRDLVAVARGDLVVVVNATSAPVDIDLAHPALTDTTVVLSTTEQPTPSGSTIAADSTIWFCR